MKSSKIIINLIFVLLILFSIIFLSNNSYADQKENMDEKRNILLDQREVIKKVSLIDNLLNVGALTSFDITLTPHTDGFGSVSLDWSKYSYQDKNFKVYKSSNGGVSYETVGVDYTSVTEVRCLQIGCVNQEYPNGTINQYKTWMEKNGYGKGIITVDYVSITDFNSRPDTYLKGSDGNYKYDVIFFGTWDVNGGSDLSATSASATERFIKSGRGCILGHDTIYYPAHPNFCDLAKYFNITVVSDYYGSTRSQVEITKKGLFTNYPWYIGGVGKILDIPEAHPLSQYAKGDIWLKFVGGTYTGCNNFYLTTYNNCAMIQTGHSTGQATDDEQKILANLIFYCNQLIFNTYKTRDRSAQDFANPNAPTATLSGNTYNFSGTDNGSTYHYYVESYSKNDTTSAGILARSATKSLTVTTGVKSYRYIYDNSLGTKVTKTTGTATTTGVGINTNYKYLHIAAIDGAGNIGPTTTVTVPQKANYTVYHQQEQLNGTYSTVESDTQVINGDIGATVTPGVKTYTGFTSPATQTVTILADGSRTVTYKYTRKSYNVVLNRGTGISGISGDGSYKYGATVSINATVSTGYTWTKWTGSKATTTKAYSFTMGAGNVENTANATANTYTVKYNGNGNTGGSTASSTHTYDTAKNLTANGFERKYTVTYNHNYSGSSNTSKVSTYTFKNWNTAANGSGTAYNNSASVKNLTTTNGGTVNLYAQWNSASVTYAPTRTGYIFGGWYKEASCTNKATEVNGTYTPTANITLYAKWTAITYTVKYNGNGSTGGSTANSTHTYDVNKALTANGYTRAYTVTYNHNYSGSSNTSKTATYSFKNWNTAANGSGTAYSNSATVKNLTTTNGGTVNLYAQWNSASVTYAPTRTGYIFGGWYKEASCTNKATEVNGTYTPTANITLYAKWTAITYTVKYNGNGSTGGSTANSTHTYDVNKALTANGYERKYTVTYNHNYAGSSNTSRVSTYTFKNWNTNASGTGTAYSNSATVKNLTTVNGGTVNLYAQWNSASVTYAPTRTGYIFGGWYKETSCTNKVAEVNGTYTPTANITLYAKWTPIVYTVKYNGNGSTGGSTASSSHTYDVNKALTANGYERKYTVTYNHNYAGSSNTSRVSTYTFKNWNTNASGTGTAYNNSQTVKNLTTTNGGTVNLYAQWNSASITYAPTRVGYIFEGWYREASCTNKVAEANGTYTPGANIILYAKWRAITYTIKYNGNGATGGATESVIHTYDTVKALRENGYTRNYTVVYNHNYKESTNISKTATYTFKNWNLMSNGTGRAYGNKESVLNLTATNGATINMYAQWESHSITYVPTREGYTFGGWYLEANCINKVSDGTYTPMSNITVYAKWIPITYTVKYEGNGATGGTTENSIHIYDEVKALTANGYERKYNVTYNHNYSGSTNTNKIATYTFRNWTTEVEGNGVTYVNRESVRNLSQTNRGIVNLYAEWNTGSITYVPEREGYTFDGWYLESSCTNKVSDATYTPMSNITLYAKWTPITYTVKYNGNGATGGATENSIHTYDEGKKLASNGFERKYTVTYNHNYRGSTDITKEATYELEDWNTKADGTGTIYKENQSVNNLTSRNGETINLYAEWRSNSVRYTPTRTGYVFEGWYEEADCINKVSDGDYTPIEDVTLYAKWEVYDYRYTVNYLEKDETPEDNTDNKVLCEPKVGGSNSYGETVSSKREVIEIDGYYYDSSKDIEITEIEENNVINIYYTKRADLDYKVNYLDKDNNKVLHEQKIVVNQIFENTVNSLDEVIEIEGYNFESSERETIEIGVGDNIINLYYAKRADLSYKVNYLEKETNMVLQEQKQVDNQKFEDIVNCINEVIEIDGFVFENTEKEAIQIGTGENVINIYYTKRTDLSYIVNYLEKDETPEENGDNRVLHEAKVVENQVFECIINSLDEVIEIDGFNFDSIDKQTIQIGTEENVVNIYYTKREDLSYVVNYLEKDSNKELHESKLVENQIFENTINCTYEVIEIDGYNFESVENESIMITTGENIINIYYTKRTDLSYVVNYLEKDSNKELHTPKVVANQRYEDTINAIEEVIEIEGYNYDSLENETIEIGTGENIVNIYYTKREDLSYKVNYLEKDSNKELHEPKIVENQRYKDIINSANEVIQIEGYDFESSENETIEIVAGENIINLYYTKRTDLSYKVEYYYDGELDESKTDVIENQTYETVIEEVTNKIIPGYKLEKTENLPLTIQEYEGLNIIKVYYIKDQFDYKVEYYYDGELDENLTNTYTATYGDVIDTYEDKVKEGYRLEKIVNMPLIVSENIESNVINVHYVRKDSTCVVKYVDKYNGEEISDATIKNGKVFDEFDVTEDVKEIERYTLVESPEIMTGIFAEEEQTKTYYYAKNTRVIVKYLEKDKEAQSLAEEVIIEGYEGKEYTLDQKEIENYTFIESTENTSGTMPREELEVVYYYLQNTKVIVNYIDQKTEENIDKVEQGGLVGDTFTAIAKDIEDYVLVESPEKETVTMTKEEIVLNYYYVHVSSGVIEKHIDINTNEVLDSTVYEGNEGDEYKTEAREFEGYDLVEDKLPENAEGTMEVEAIEVKYYYERKTEVRVEYIDKITNEKLAEDEYIYGHENNTYETKEKEFEDYIAVKEMYPENATGIMKVTIKEDGTVNTETVVKYYYVHKSEGVTERHLNAINGELLEEIVNHEGNEGDEYNISPKTFEGYDTVKERIPENAKGQMTRERIVVSYYYVRKAEVEVEYIDKYSSEKLQEKVKINEEKDVYTEKDSTEIIEGHEGDIYETKEKEFEKYKLVETSNNTSGTMKVSIEEDGTINTRTKVTYYYAKESAGVKEEHIDIITGEVINKEVHTGYEGDKYTTYEKDIKGYVLVKEHYPENKEGIMTKDEVEVKYYYARVAKVEVEYIDQETKAKIIDNVIIDGYEGKKYSTEAKVFEGYKLFDKPENAEGKMKITEDEDRELENTIKVRYYYVRVPEEISKPNEQRPTTITNVYNNGLLTSVDSNGNSSNNNSNGNSLGNSGNSNNENGDSNNNSAVTNYEKTPGTGDKIAVIAITVLILIVSNIVITYKKRKDKKNFIK